MLSKTRDTLSFSVLFVIGSLFTRNVWMYYNQNSYDPDNGTQAACILFDFDGTLVDSFDVTINTCNQLACEFGFDPITDEQKTHLRNISTKDIITKYLKIPWLKLPFLHKRATTLMAEHIPHLPLIDGMEKVLRELKSQGYRLGILSSNSEEGIKNFLKKNNLEIFDDVYAESSIFGKHRVMRKFLSNANVHPKNVVYIGDEVRDIEATNKIGISIIAVDWGFGTRESLLAHNPHSVISHPSELMAALKSVSLLG